MNQLYLKPNYFVGIDFETFYAPDYSLSSPEIGQDYAKYVNHPKFDAYLVAIVTETMRWVGRPSLAPWHELGGKVAVAHNAPFDYHVFERLRELGAITAPSPAGWHCTAYSLTAPRGRLSLKDAWRLHFNETVNKQPRDDMSGRRFDELAETERVNLSAMCVSDADKARQLAIHGAGARFCRSHDAIAFLGDPHDTLAQLDAARALVNKLEARAAKMEAALMREKVDLLFGKASGDE